MKTWMCSSKALPTQHSFVRNKKGQVRAYGLHMASCGVCLDIFFANFVSDVTRYLGHNPAVYSINIAEI